MALANHARSTCVRLPQAWSCNFNLNKTDSQLTVISDFCGFRSRCLVALIGSNLLTAGEDATQALSIDVEDLEADATAEDLMLSYVSGEKGKVCQPLPCVGW